VRRATIVTSSARFALPFSAIPRPICPRSLPWKRRRIIYRLTVHRVPSLRMVLLLALLPLVAGCGNPRPKLVDAPPAKTTFAGGALSPPRAAPPLALTDASGRPFTLSALRGRHVLVTFLYTHCPDVCPLIASSLNTVLRTIGPAAKVEVLAVSVDPKGDTPQAVRAYARKMHLEPAFHYLIGTRPQLRLVWAAWNVLSVNRKPNLVDHIAYTALIDAKGRERVLYDAQVSAQQVLHDLRLLTKQRV
jgi:protein SCO1/2